MHRSSTQNLRVSHVLRGCLPLAEDGVVDQVGRSVQAAEGVVNRLVSDRQRRVVGHNGVIEEVLGVFARHVLWRAKIRGQVNKNPRPSLTPDRLLAVSPQTACRSTSGFWASGRR